MSRLLLSSVLVALVVGLTLLACVPIEDELLPNIGDEMRITNDPEPNYDPRWYNIWELYEPTELRTAQIVYHDGHTVYLYSFEDKSTIEFYSAPAGFEITALGSTRNSLLLAIHDGSEMKVIYYKPSSGSSTTLYQDNGVEVESIAGEESGYQALLGRADGNIYSLVISSCDQVDYGIYSDGFDVHLWDNEFASYSFASDVGDSTIIYWTRFESDGFIQKQETLNNGYYNRYPIYERCLSDAGGDNDIWDFHFDNQITDKDGDEIELDATLEYIVFNRVVDGRSDIYVVRSRHYGQ